MENALELSLRREAGNRDGSIPARAATSQTLPFAPLRVLVADDDSGVRFVHALALIRAGYQVDRAEDGESAWSLLTSEHYDLLVTDHEMPQLTGLSLARRLRAAGFTLPVILVSGSFDLPSPGDDAIPDHVLMLRKPVPLPELLAAVQRSASVAATADCSPAGNRVVPATPLPACSCESHVAAVMTRNTAAGLKIYS